MESSQYSSTNATGRRQPLHDRMVEIRLVVGHPDLTHAEGLLLVDLLTYMPFDGGTWQLSRRRLSDDLYRREDAAGRSNVDTLLKSLITKGFVSAIPEHRKNGSRASNSYEVVSERILRIEDGTARLRGRKATMTRSRSVAPTTTPSITRPPSRTVTATEPTSVVMPQPMDDSSVAITEPRSTSSRTTDSTNAAGPSDGRCALPASGRGPGNGAVADSVRPREWAFENGELTFRHAVGAGSVAAIQLQKAYEVMSEQISRGAAALQLRRISETFPGLNEASEEILILLSSLDINIDE